MHSRYSLGSIARIYFDLIDVDTGVTAQTPTVAIQRLGDEKWFQASDGTWQTDPVDNEMIETSSALMPGRYQFDFDQSLDDLQGSTCYIAKKANAVDFTALEYDDLVFGPLAGASSPNVCMVQGSIYTGDGKPARSEFVRATLQPIFKDGIGRGVQSDKVIIATTNDTGDFSLPLVRGGIFRLEVPAIGYDRKVTIPDQASVLFTDL